MIRIVRNAAFLSAMVMGLVFTSCKNEKSDSEKEEMTSEQHMNHDAMDHSETKDQEELKATGMAAFSEESVAKTYEHYLAVKDALVATDAEKAAEHAGKLAASASGEVAGAAKRLSETTDVNQQREVFSELTAAMEAGLKGAIASGKIYKQFCPMAFEGKGDYWFSNSEQIRNPYFGDKMLKCGRVEETIE